MKKAPKRKHIIVEKDVHSRVKEMSKEIIKMPINDFVSIMVDFIEENKDPFKKYLIDRLTKGG